MVPDTVAMSDATEATQQLVFDLMQKRLLELFGPGGSFRVELGRADEGEALFASTVAHTVAWDVAESLGTVRSAAPRRAVVAEPAPEHRVIWQYVDEELARRRSFEDAAAAAHDAAVQDADALDARLDDADLQDADPVHADLLGVELHESAPLEAEHHISRRESYAA